MVASVLSPVVAIPNQLASPSVSREGDRTVVWLDGEHDIATLLLLQDTLARAISADGADLVIDLSGVTFIDATTIGELIRGRNTLRHQSRSLTLRSPSRRARRLLDLCGLTDLVEPHELRIENRIEDPAVDGFGQFLDGPGELVG